MVEAATLRLRPILMTTGAMVLRRGAAGAGDRRRRRVAHADRLGDRRRPVFGTLLTLFVVPTAYTLLAGRAHIEAHGLKTAARGWQCPPPQPAPGGRAAG